MAEKVLHAFEAGRIQKIKLEDLVEKDGLGCKEYVRTELKRYSHDRGVEFVFQARDEKITYVGSVVCEQYEKSRRIKIDSLGLPFYRATLGPITFDEYDIGFLGNTCFAEAMGGAYQSRILEILEFFKKKDHEVYQKFINDIESIIKKAPLIFEAKLQKYFLKNESALKRFSRIEKVIFEYLTCENISSSFLLEGSSLGEFNPDNYNVKDIRLSSRQHVDFKNGSTKEEAAFIEWYKDYADQRGYRDLIEKSKNNWLKALQEWTREVESCLQENGFEKMGRLSK